MFVMIQYVIRAVTFAGFVFMESLANPFVAKKIIKPILWMVWDIVMTLVAGYMRTSRILIKKGYNSVYPGIGNFQFPV